MNATQPREGQAYKLPLSANTDERTTHVAIQKQHGFMYFCRFDPTEKHGQDGVPDSEVHGTYWIVPCELYGSCYNGASLWQGGFNFVPISEWSGGRSPSEDWDVMYYGNRFVVQREVNGKTEWLGGWDHERCRPARTFATITEATEAKEAAA